MTNFIDISMIVKNLKTFLICCSVLLVIMPNTYAHHSRNEFSKQSTQLTGTLTKVIWRNPHIAIFMDVENNQGDIENWRIETFGAPITFRGAGISKELFNVGEKITLIGNVSNARDHYILGTNALLSNGTEVILGSIYKPHWKGPYIGGETKFTGKDPEVVDATKENKGIFRVWSIPGRAGSVDGGVGRVVDLPFTEQAISSRDDWDPVDNPIARCEQPGMPSPAMQPVIFQFTKQAQNIIFHSSFFDTQRLIHMGDTKKPDEISGTHLGYSTGRWEGNTLIIHTTDIDYPYFAADGTRQGTDIDIIERYTLSEDQSRLDLHMTIEDDFTFTRPAIYQWHFLALGQSFSPYECNVF